MSEQTLISGVLSDEDFIKSCFVTASCTVDVLQRSSWPSAEGEESALGGSASVPQRDWASDADLHRYHENPERGAPSVHSDVALSEAWEGPRGPAGDGLGVGTGPRRRRCSGEAPPGDMLDPGSAHGRGTFTSVMLRSW